MIKYHRIPADISDRLERLAFLLQQDQRVIFAYLFGGLASGVQKPLSDVDIAVMLDSSVVDAEVKLDLICHTRLLILRLPRYGLLLLRLL